MKKVLMTILLVVAILSPVSAQGQKESTSGNTEKLTIWSWGADNEKKAREAAVEIFQKEHPEIEVQHSVIPTTNHAWDQKMIAAFSAGTGPDVIQMSPDYYGLYTKYYEDVAPYLAQEHIDVDTVITSGMLQPYYTGDKLDGMPLLENVFVLAYNKDMFDSFGVSYPNANWTWDDLEKAAEKFATGTGANATYGIVNHWVLPNFALICEGGLPYTDDLSECLVNDPRVEKGLDLFGKLLSSKAMPSDVAAKSIPKEQLFVSGHAAMYPLGGFEASLIAEEIGDNFAWDVVTMPRIEGGNKNNMMYATGYSMLKTSKHKDAAWQFMKEMAYANDEMATTTAAVGIPSNAHIAQTVYKNITNGPIDNTAYVDGAANARLNIFGGAFSAAGDQWTQIWQAVTIGGDSGKEAMQKYYPLLEQAFNEAKSSK